MDLGRYAALLRSSHVWLLAPTWIAVNASIGLWFSQAIFQFSKANPRFPDQVLMRGFTPVQISLAAVVDRDRLRRRPALLGQPVQELPADDDHRSRHRRRRRPRGRRLRRQPRRGAADRPADRRRASPSRSGCSSSPGRRRRRSGCSPTCRSAFPADRGAIMGLYSVFLALGQIVGSLIGGVAADWHGIDGLLVAHRDLPRDRARAARAAARPGASARRRASRAGAGARSRSRRDGPRTERRHAASARSSRCRSSRGAHGAVVAPHHLATAAGLAILRAGGHAVDAAIATNAVLGVVLPSGCGIGGDAFWLIWDEAAGRQTALNGSGRAPAAADRGRAPGRRARRPSPTAGRSRSPSRARSARGATRTPGTAGCRAARSWRRRSSWPGTGSRRGTGSSRRSRRRCRRSSRRSAPGSGFEQVYRPHGRAVAAGRAGSAAGPRGDARAAGRRRLRRLLRRRDRRAPGARARGRRLRDHGSTTSRAHTSTWTEPIATDYRGVRVTTHPPNSSGIVALELLNILETFEPPAAAAFGPDGVEDAALGPSRDRGRRSSRWPIATST